MRLRALVRPSPLRSILILCVLAPLAFVPGCHQQTDYPPVPRTTQQGQAGTIVLTVVFVRDVDEILAVCPNLKGGMYYGCAKQTALGCEIYLQQPTDFNDAPRLATLGHEAMHCLGGRHE